MVQGLAPREAGQVNEQAGVNRELLSDAGIFAVHLCGNAGSGRTALLDATFRRLAMRAKVGVVVAHPGAARDAATLQRAGAAAFPIEAGGFDARKLHDAVSSLVLAPRRVDLLMIEDGGQSDASIDVGQAARVAVFSVSGGDGMPAQCVSRIRGADLVLLTKTDLLPYVSFDVELFSSEVRRADPKAKIIQLSATDGTGMDQWIDWLMGRVLRAKTERANAATQDASEWWFG